MSLSSYPDVGYRESSVGASDNTIRRKAANGRIIVNDLGAYSDVDFEIVHPFVTISDVKLIEEFWENTRGEDFYFHDNLRKTWRCSFVGRPVVQHFQGTYYNVTVRMIRRDETEND